VLIFDQLLEDLASQPIRLFTVLRAKQRRNSEVQTKYEQPGSSGAHEFSL